MGQQIDPARRAALRLLCAVTQDGQLLSEAMPDVLGKLEPPLRARAQRLAHETFRWMDRADRMLGAYLRQRPPEPTLNALRLGCVEMCHLNEAPYGVVDALVSLVTVVPEARRTSGLVNALLRNVARDRAKWAELPVPRVPKWLRKKLIAAYGKEVVAEIELAHTRGAPLDITGKPAPLELATLVGGRALSTGSVRIEGSVEVTKLPGFDDGLWWVQDAAAALPARALAAAQGERILDLCAAPGGKTMQMAQAGADVTALDISSGRMGRMAQNLERTGLHATQVVADALEYRGDPFDAVLLDAPCSATGTIRRHPELVYAKTLAAIEPLFDLQAKMLRHAAELVRPGGRLVYCTCSLLPEEGEMQVHAFLQANAAWSVDVGGLTAAGIDPTWIGQMGARTRPDFWADQGGMDGFFISVLRKSA